MPRSNHPRRRGGQADHDDEETDLGRALAMRFHTVRKRDGLWNVQPVSATQAVKAYLCPGCGGDIEPGTAHTVAWRADGILGEADAVRQAVARPANRASGLRHRL